MDKTERHHNTDIKMETVFSLLVKNSKIHSENDRTSQIDRAVLTQKIKMNIHRMKLINTIYMKINLAYSIISLKSKKQIEMARNFKINHQI